MPNAEDICNECLHQWHGLPCQRTTYMRGGGYSKQCPCESSFKYVEPEALAAEPLDTTSPVG